MNDYLQTSRFLSGRISNRELISGLRCALDRNYTRILQAASHEWQRRFAGFDPSDACVSVRISPFVLNRPATLAKSRLGR